MNYQTIEITTEQTFVPFAGYEIVIEIKDQECFTLCNEGTVLCVVSSGIKGVITKSYPTENKDGYLTLHIRPLRSMDSFCTIGSKGVLSIGELLEIRYNFY